MDKLLQSPKTIFINNICSYSSKNIAKHLSECDLESSSENDEDMDVSETSGTRAARFQVVGTVSKQPEEDTSFVMEHYFQLDRESLLSKLMACDVVIYNVTQHADQVEEAMWAVLALHDKIHRFSGPKMFILISTVMTWASGKPLDPDEPELPFTDEIYRTRKPHPNFKQHIDLEKKVVKLGKTNTKLFSAHVVASGLHYGMGEHTLHYFFKTSWLGHESAIPVFGDGKNFVPMIHISDLARLIQNMIDHRPVPQYMLAADSSKSNMGNVVMAIGAALGTGKIRKEPFEQLYLRRDMSVMEIDTLQVNLRIEATYIKNFFSFEWHCESGLVENIELVVKEFLQARELQPIRICVLGAPAVGKTTVCKEICEQYKLHYVQWKPPSDPELEDQLSELKEQLISQPCRNQGFVLDGFPETYKEAEELFPVLDESESAPKVLPDSVFCLDATDDFLIDRVINLPESFVQMHNYDQDRFLKRLARYRETNMVEEPVINYFMEQDLTPVHLKITGSSNYDWLLLMQNIVDTVGPPKNYRPTKQELQEEEMRRAEERMMKEEKERAVEEEWEKEESRSRDAQWKEWTLKLEGARQLADAQRALEVEAQRQTSKNYLQKNVLPTLSAALIECCKVKPGNPRLFVADYLIIHNPFPN